MPFKNYVNKQLAVGVFAALAGTAIAQTVTEAEPEQTPAASAKETLAACTALTKRFETIRSKLGASTDSATCEPLREDGKLVGHAATYTFGESFTGLRRSQLAAGLSCGSAERAFNEKFSPGLGFEPAKCEPVMDLNNEEKHKAIRTVFRFQHGL